MHCQHLLRRRHAKQKAQQGDFAAAALALAQHGASPDVGNLELYAHVAREVLGVPADAADPQAEQACSTFLRAVLVQLEAGRDAAAPHAQVCLKPEFVAPGSAGQTALPGGTPGAAEGGAPCHSPAHAGEVFR